MEFNPDKHADPDRDAMAPLAMFALLLKVVTFVVLLAVGLKLTFWAVDVVDQLLHRPDEIALLRPLLDQGSGAERSFAIERNDHGLTVRDHNTGSLFLMVLLLLVLFGAIGRAIAALIGGAVRIVGGLDFKRPRPPRPPD